MCSSASCPEAEASDGPVGAQGVSLTPGRSLAVDPSYHALGTPVFVAARRAERLDGAPFRRLMIAQDVGSAIKGPERGDIYCGSGEEAGAHCREDHGAGEVFVLLPKSAGRPSGICHCQLERAIR